ncbi:MAG: outer membrane beta-barrel protein [Candidatus Sulfotelmatobacter sp.]
MCCIRAFFVAVLFCLVVSSFAFGQDSRADLFGGYSYLNIDTNGLSSRQNANGWEVAVSGNFNKWFAVEGDGAGYYKSYSANLAELCSCSASLKVTDYSFAAGPRINLKPVFFHALFGGDHLHANASATVDGEPFRDSPSQDVVAGLVGGGVQWKVSGPWSVRASTDYVFTRHNIFGGSSVTQNNFRAGAGIVYSFGGKSASDTDRAVRPAEHVPESHPSMSIPGLGIMASPRTEGGAEIVAIAPGSVAALANLHVGYVITSVDGKPVNSPMELAADLQNRESGSQVHLRYLFRSSAVGWLANETVVILGANK